MSCFQKLAEILFKSAREGSYIDPRKVEEILEVFDTEIQLPTKKSGKTKFKTYTGK